MTDSNHVRFIAEVAGTIGIVSLVWPETSRLVREIWKGFTEAVFAVQVFRDSLRARSAEKRSHGGPVQTG
jgi:hypothetical protein